MPKKKVSRKKTTKKPSPTIVSWENRIVGHEEISPESIVKNDANWREHPSLQKDRMTAILEDIGWIDELIVNKITGRLINGHMRLDLAIQQGEPLVPVRYVELSEDEERRALATYDTITYLATQNRKKLRELQESTKDGLERMQHLTEEHKKTISKMVEENVSLQGTVESSIKRKAGRDEAEERETFDSTSPMLEGIKDLSPVMEYEYGLPYDIPELRRDMLSDCPEPIATWTAPDSSEDSPFYLTVCNNGNCRGLPWKNTILCFYTEDHHFFNLWEAPHIYLKKMLNRGFYASLTPDYSIYVEMAFAQKIFNVFRQRWIGRYMQEAGIRVIPSVSHFQVDSKDEIVYTGIPFKPPCIAMEVQSLTRGDSDKDRVLALLNKSIHKALDVLKPESLIIYGSDFRFQVIEDCRFPKSLHIISIENYISARGRWLSSVRETQV